MEKKVKSFLDLFATDSDVKKLKEIEKLKEIFLESSVSHNKKILQTNFENLQQISKSYEKILKVIDKVYQERYKLTLNFLDTIIEIKNIDVRPLLQVRKSSTSEITKSIQNMMKEIDFKEEYDVDEFINSLKTPPILCEFEFNLKALNSPLILNLHQLSCHFGKFVHKIQ
jgi:hypothetical protein